MTGNHQIAKKIVAIADTHHQYFSTSHESLLSHITLCKRPLQGFTKTALTLHFFKAFSLVWFGAVYNR